MATTGSIKIFLKLRNTVSGRITSWYDLERNFAYFAYFKKIFPHFTLPTSENSLIQQKVRGDFSLK